MISLLFTVYLEINSQLFSCETQRHLLGVLANYQLPNNWKVECSNKTLLLFIYKHSDFQIQWNPINVISDNVIIRLMLSNWPRLTKCRIIIRAPYICGKFATCHDSINVIILSLSKSDHIKWLLQTVILNEFFLSGWAKRAMRFWLSQSNHPFWWKADAFLKH